MAKVVRLCDYERRSREPDACAEQRDPSQAGAIIIILPMLRPEPPCDVTFDDGVVTISVGEYRDVFGPADAQVFERPPEAVWKRESKMKSIAKLALALGLALACACEARAQTADPFPLVPLGYCQLTSIDSSTLVSTCSGGIPAGATMALVQPEAQAVRWRDDGTAPSATVGFPLAVGASIFYTGRLSALQVISQVAGAKLNILFYR